ncbi:MAG: ABC transporter ATP-binding protein [Caldiserica bacterium]|nr:ABC transporter ATP-binding protein [Caldisericota bacterium]
MDVAIALRGVRKALGGREILRGITLEVHRGDVFGYLGPNGAGKTTTIRVILGLLSPDSGEVSILGKRAGPGPRSRVGFVLESDGLFDGLTAAENLLLFARLYGVRGPRIDELLELVGLPGERHERVGKLSRGMRQRLALARALLHDPEILVLDEPTVGLDPSGQMELRGLVRELAAAGKTIFFSSHNLDEVERLCNRIALIHRGEIRLQGEVEALRAGGRGYVVELSAEPPPAAVEELRADGRLGLTEAHGRRLVLDPADGVGIPELAQALQARGLEIEAIYRRRASLEELYRRILAEGT